MFIVKETSAYTARETASRVVEIDLSVAQGTHERPADRNRYNSGVLLQVLARERQHVFSPQSSTVAPTNWKPPETRLRYAARRGRTAGSIRRDRQLL